jgi:hypothetical protein
MSGGKVLHSLFGSGALPVSLLTFTVFHLSRFNLPLREMHQLHNMLASRLKTLLSHDGWCGEVFVYKRDFGLSQDVMYLRQNRHFLC